MFAMRTTKPEAGNKFYNNSSNGGQSWCVNGHPTDAGCNVLANCVGYACGRFNEIIGEFKYKTLCCNAENFIEKAKAAGLEVGSTPKAGAIMCWMKGATLSGSDGAGHVAIVERVYDNNHVYTSESGWSSAPFWNSHRYNNNGRWGMGNGYTFRGFIYNPAVQDEPTIPVIPNVSRDEYANQIEVKVSDLNVRSDAGTDKSIVGIASKGFYNYYETKDTSGYTWYRIDDGKWIASSNDWTTVYQAKSREPISLKYSVGQTVVFNGTLYADSRGNGAGQSRSNHVCTITLTENSAGTTKPYNIDNGLGWVSEEDIQPYTQPVNTLNVGDTVKIVSSGKSSCYGDNPSAGGIGWTRQILGIFEGKPYPYKVGNSTGVTGYYKAEALQRI